MSTSQPDSQSFADDLNIVGGTMPSVPCDASVDSSLPPRIKGATDHSEAALDRRRELLRRQKISTSALSGDQEFATETLAGNIENFVGFARVPVGVIGPLRIRGESANGDFYDLMHINRAQRTIHTLTSCVPIFIPNFSVL